MSGGVGRGPVLTWVIVSYGGVDDAVRLVDSLGAGSPVDIVLCANRPGDTDEATAAFAGDRRVRVLSFEDNPGYLPALQRALPHVDTTRPVVLSNCDLLADPGVVDDLIEQVEAFPDAGWLAPSIIGSLGQDQTSCTLRRRAGCEPWQRSTASHRSPTCSCCARKVTARAPWPGSTPAAPSSRATGRASC